ncbi:MAG: hypothetical protein RJQ04_13495 [Longimicrobiales bacterium]
MSAEDQVRPYHAKPEQSGQETADAVAAVLKHAHEKDAAAKTREGPRKQPRWMLPVGINLAVFAVYLLIAPPAWVTVSPIEGPTVAEQAQDMRSAMWFQAQRVDAFREANGRLPADIAETGSTPYEGVDYVPQGSSYQLIATVGDEVVVYDSAGPDPSFQQSAMRAMTGAGG